MGLSLDVQTRFSQPCGGGGLTPLSAWQRRWSAGASRKKLAAIEDGNRLDRLFTG